MLIEIHMIQNHSPSNLNRDDLGAPKTCIFGGVTRARISSQCLKRSIRRSAEFAKALERDGGIRTRRLITILSEEASGSQPAPREVVDYVTKAFEKGGVKKDATAEDPDATNILLFVPLSTITQMASTVRDARERGDKPEVLAARLAESLGEAAAVPDIALCGRMTELDADGLFRKIDFHVEAALQAAHALSTHEVITEVDYFTAVDDRAVGTGAGHVNEAMFNSACYYKYFCLDWDQLLANLRADKDWAMLTLRQFITAAALSMPSGKQHSFAAHNPPEGMLVEVKATQRTPICHANAFADPVPARAPRGLVGESIARLGQHVHDLAEGYGIAADRFWFSPAGRHKLTYTDGGAEQPVLPEPANLRSLASLIDAVAGRVSKPSANPESGS